MILFFDTETTGLPRSWKAPVTDLSNWPRLVQLAYILSDKSGNVVEQKDFIIKPNGFTIPRDASDIHGITHSRALAEGVELSQVLSAFSSLLDRSTHLVAHSISFDEKIIGAEFLRTNVRKGFPSIRKICTMESSTNYCAISGPYGYKWPKLSELHYKLFRDGFDEAHNAAVDIRATAKCFWEMRKRGWIAVN